MLYSGVPCYQLRKEAQWRLKVKKKKLKFVVLLARAPIPNMRINVKSQKKNLIVSRKKGGLTSQRTGGPFAVAFKTGE